MLGENGRFKKGPGRTAGDIEHTSGRLDQNQEYQKIDSRGHEVLPAAVNRKNGYPLYQKLASIDINNLTPIEAINLIHQIKNKIDEDK